MLRQYYKSLPVVSKSLPVLKLAWFIGRVEPAAASSMGPWAMLFQKPASVVIFAYYAVYSPTLHVRAEAFSANEDDAQTLTDQVSAFLNLFHAAENAVGTGGSDPDVKAFFDSLHIERHGDRSVLTAAVPPGFLRKVVGESEEGAHPQPHHRRLQSGRRCSRRSTNPAAKLRTKSNYLHKMTLAGFRT